MQRLDMGVNSGKLGRNSDIAALSDFSDDMEETGVRPLSGCRIPGCKCNSECETNASDRVLQTEQESPKLVPTVQPILVADDVYPHTVGSTCGPRTQVYYRKQSEHI